MHSNTKALTALAIIILLFLLFHLFIQRPVSQEYYRLQERSRELGPLLTQAQLELLGLPGVRDEIQLLNRQLKLVKEKYPDSIPPVVGYITEAAAELGLDISSREEPTSWKDLPGVEKRLIRVEGRGAYRTVGEFLKSLEQLPIRLSVSGLEIEGEEMTGTDVTLKKLLLDVFLKKGT